MLRHWKVPGQKVVFRNGISKGTNNSMRTISGHRCIQSDKSLMIGIRGKDWHLPVAYVVKSFEDLNSAVHRLESHL